MTNVLIVDDEKSIRIGLREFLAADGYKVHAVANVQEALRLLGACVFDVVISDIVLPGISGMDLLKSIASASPASQVIMMTGAPTVDTAAEALRCGAFDYLVKPVGKNAVRRAVANALKIKAVDDERHRLEKENLAYRQNLEHLVDGRTRELTEANRRLAGALENVREMQQHVVRQERLNALGQMVSGIAHDFNNVLMPIVGLSDYLLSEPDAFDNPEEVRETLRIVSSAARDAREIVRRLREFYKPGETAAMQEADLSVVCEDAVRLMRPRWKTQAESEGRRINILVKFPHVVMAEINTQEIREVMCNLIINACDAMPKGGRITLHGTTRKGITTLRVSDTGIGMTLDDRNQCLEPFFTTKGERGSGLGLSMCHGIVSRHGGTVDVQSEVGRGTTIVLSLPVKQKARENHKEPECAMQPEPVTGLKICVVDDEAPSRLLIEKYLKKSGHMVSGAASGQEALALVESEHFDLLITDRAMPDMSGDALAKAFKACANSIPVLMVTGFGDLMNSRGNMPDGVDLVVPKPLTAVEIRDAVSRLWAQRQRM